VYFIVWSTHYVTSVEITSGSSCSASAKESVPFEDCAKAVLNTVARPKISVSVFFMALQPPVGQGLLNVEASRLHSTHTTIGRTPLDEWLSRHRDLYLTTHNTHNRHPRPRRDSNPQSQQASGRRPTPQAARPLGSASVPINLSEIEFLVIQFVASRWQPINVSLAGYTTSESLLCHR
jgi:hypothetical protein